MKMRSFQLLAALVAVCCATSARADDAKCPNGTMKVLVAPFENGGTAKAANAAYSFGLAAIVAEALENDPCITPLTGPLVLTEELVKLYTPQGKLKDAAKLDAYARASGVTHVLTGTFQGPTDKWDLRVSLAAIGALPEGALRQYVTASRPTNITAMLVNSSGRPYRDVSMQIIQGLLADGVRRAFTLFTAVSPGSEPATATIDAMRTPGTSQAYAFLKLSRSYARYFAIDLPAKRQFDALKTWQAKARYLAAARKWRTKGSERFTATGLAGTAIGVDPKYGAAQRFYAFLLADKADKESKARLHYELAAEANPSDYRSLMALGTLEMSFDNAKKAERYFGRAAQLRLADAEPRYLQGMACKALGDTSGAMAAFIGARNVRPSHADARRELAMLYSAVHQDADAAREYGEIVRYRPDDKDAAFKHAASLRAAGRLNGAERRLHDYAETFPSESRFPRFRGDVLAMLGRSADARASYAAAAARGKSERRAAALAAGNAGTDLLGGASLLQAAVDAGDVAQETERHRAAFQYALDDAILDLQNHGSEACMDGRGASSALLARDERAAHAASLGRLAEIATAIRTAFRSGEDASLTVSEQAFIAASLSATTQARRDTVEMDSSWARSFLPAYRRNKCGAYDGAVHAATLAQVLARNGSRSTKRPELPWLPQPMPFSPRITPTSARVIRFTVDNTRSKADSSVTLDGTPIGTVAKGAKAIFNTRAGVHRICIVQDGGNCQDDGAEHTDYFREGWVIKIRT